MLLRNSIHYHHYLQQLHVSHVLFSTFPLNVVESICMLIINYYVVATFIKSFPPTSYIPQPLHYTLFPKDRHIFSWLGVGGGICQPLF
jgi:hypothetical protein